MRTELDTTTGGKEHVGSCEGALVRIALSQDKETNGSRRTLDVAVNLVLVVQVLEAEEQFATDDGDVGFGERAGLEL